MFRVKDKEYYRSTEDIDCEICGGGSEGLETYCGGDVYFEIGFVDGYEVALTDEEHHAEGNVDHDDFHSFEELLSEEGDFCVFLELREGVEEDSCF